MTSKRVLSKSAGALDSGIETHASRPAKLILSVLALREGKDRYPKVSYCAHSSRDKEAYMTMKGYWLK
jgi:hypothetical protein